jgi:hypothetical protein
VNVVAGLATWYRELPVRDIGQVNQIHPLIPKVKPLLKPLRKDMFLASVLATKRDKPRKQVDGPKRTVRVSICS